MARKSISSLFIDLRANSSKLRKDVQKAAFTIKKAVAPLAKSLAVSVGGATAALGVMVAKAAKAGDQLAKTADKLGVTTEKLAGLRFAAEQTGVGTEKLDTALQRMTRRIAEAAQGSGEAQGALRELGLDANKLASSSPDEAFRQVAEAMGEVQSQSDKVRLAFKLFDSEGVGLINTLKLGREGLDEMQREAEELGIAIKRADAAKFEQLNDSVNRLRKLFEGARNVVAIELAPAITAMTNVLFDSTKQAGGLGKALDGVGSKTVFIVGTLSNLGAGLRFIFDSFALIGTAAVRAFQPINLGISKLKLSLAKLVVDYAQNVGRIIDSTKNLINQTTASVIRFVNDGFRDVTNKAKERINELIRLANKLPGINVDQLDPSKGNLIPTPPKVGGNNEKNLTEFTSGLVGIEKIQNEIKATEKAIKATEDSIRKRSSELLDTRLPSEILRAEFESLKAEAIETNNSVNDSINNTFTTSTGAMADAAQKAGDELESLAERFRDLGTTDAQRFNKEMADLNRVFKEGLISVEQYTLAAEKLKERYIDAKGNIQNAYTELGNNLGDSLQEFARTGELSFDRLRDSALNSIAQIARNWIQNLLNVQRAAAQTQAATATALGGAAGGGGSSFGSIFGSIATSALGSFFGGARESGGRVSTGRSYLVGEKGTELFEPDVAGKIVPNRETVATLSGGGGEMINVTLNFETGVTQAELQSTVPVIVEMVKEGVLSGVGEGGKFRRGIRA